MDRVIIGTRGSALALWQAHYVAERLVSCRPEVSFIIKVVKTEGDQRHDLTPEEFGREGIFTAELDRALLENRIDMAVHSLKDLPTRFDPRLALAAVTERASPADVFILRQDHVTSAMLSSRSQAAQILAGLTAPLIVGTSSLRRIAQLKHRFPVLEFAPMRGNLDTRLRKITAKEVDAIVVAEAGLIRLEFNITGHLILPLPAELMLPAAGQGALAVETLAVGKARSIAALIDHKQTRAVVTAERAAMSALGAGCRVPAGFLAEFKDHGLRLRGVVGAADGGVLIAAETEGPAQDAEALGMELAEALKAQGAEAILKELRG